MVHFRQICFLRFALSKKGDKLTSRIGFVIGLNKCSEMHVFVLINAKSLQNESSLVFFSIFFLLASFDQTQNIDPGKRSGSNVNHTKMVRHKCKIDGLSWHPKHATFLWSIKNCEYSHLK